MLSPWRLLCAQNPERDRTRRSADRVPHQFGAGDQPQNCESAWPRNLAHAVSPRRRGDRMSNCHLVAGRSLIDLAASRLALHAPAQRAATALTRPNGSARWLPCGRRAAPTAVTVDPSRTVTEHGVERG